MENLACDIYSLMTIILCLFAIRVAHVLICTGKPFKVLVPVRTLIILGSGGHTAEMLSLVNILQKDRFFPRFYIAAATDNMSLQKARVLEESLIQQDEDTPPLITHSLVLVDSEVNLKNSIGKKIDDSNFLQIYRSREVGQSYITSIWTTLIAILHALWVMLKIRPQVIICNGPGTCIPLCAIAFLFKVVGIRWSSIFYVESIARVRKFSLSGLLLYQLHLADQIFVQWPKLQCQHPRTHYVGRLM